MENLKRTRRSDDELLSELREREAKILARQAKKDASANPVLAPIVDALDDVNNSLLAAKRGFAEKGPQSFSARIAKAEARIESIEIQRSEAEAVIHSAIDEKAVLRTLLASYSTKLANGEDVSEAEVTDSLNS
jgi:translation initiation factor 2B subunit (eIF-2B alpha/beta/delta family)